MKHFFTFILFASFVLRAQSDSSGVDFYEMSLEDLLNVKVSVASAGELTSRESPGIVTLITQEEIKNSGARDLMELLSFVPGVSFHQDVQGSVGIGMRGNWGHEGKILMILDGQELNENLYSTLNFGNHYDLSSIKQIEIIRGPGSSTYGGYAELGVIKITTYSAEEINGLELGATYGQYDKSYARRNVSLSMGKKFNDFSVVYHGFLGQGNRSQDEYSDFYGDSISLVNGLKANPFVSNLGMSYKNLSARFVYDYYENITPIWFDELLPEPLKIRYRNVFGELKYQWKVSEKVSLVPRLAYTNQLPWSNEPTEEAVEFKLQAARITPSVIANFQFSPSVSLMAGGEYFHDVAKNFAEETSPYFDNGTDYISYDNMAVFSQLNVRHKWFNTILGGRYNHHSVFGPSLVPRIGITKIINKFHTKLLYSYAYRSPSIENIVSNEDIIPENTR
ncbi:MAG: TonB-dependent receptor plug domain-containing protein, partial [Cytophagaceae bacterium]|nr:TonB-dependent receptor plug domain-containing protein [Cytophagaceae bacterium]